MSSQQRRKGNCSALLEAVNWSKRQAVLKTFIETFDNMFSSNEVEEWEEEEEEEEEEGGIVVEEGEGLLTAAGIMILIPAEAEVEVNTLLLLLLLLPVLPVQSSRRFGLVSNSFLYL